MKVALVLALAATHLGWSGAGPASGFELEDETATVAVGELGERIVAWARAAESAGFRGAVLAAKDGEVVAAVGVGFADLRDKRPNTPATLFEIASASKPITSTAVMLLVQEGKLDLDAPMADYLPGVPKDCSGITVKHLLAHTSGIPGSNSQGGGKKLRPVLSSFLRGGPRHEPGRHFEYWNQGYALLSEVIARASGEDYVDYCKQSLFEPAGMTSSRFTGDKAPKGATVSVGRSGLGEPRSALDHPYGVYGFQYRGMGGVVTNVWDLWRWDRALAGDELLGRDAKRAMFRRGPGEYALGWYVKPTETGRKLQSHTGRVRGFVCDVRRYPKDDACLFVLANDDRARVRSVAQGIEELLFDEEPTILPPPALLDAKLLKAVEGTYESEGGRLFKIVPDGPVARAEIHWGPPSGPVTYAVLGRGEEGGFVFYEWTAVHPIEFERKGKKRAKAISMMGTEYARSR